MTGLSRIGRLISVASEILDSDVEPGSLAFMGQALVQTTLPHSDPGVPYFERSSGAVSLSIIANPKLGLPFGTVPRLLLAWICTEAVRTKSPLLSLGRSQNEFLRKLGMRTDGRDCQRLKSQSLKLFSSMLSITYQCDGRFGLKNMPIADEAFVLWDPHHPDDRMLWESTLRLSGPFFRNVTESPVPIDMRALRALSKSPLAMDIYSWLVYRIFLLRVKNRAGVVIPWASLKLQFGSDYGDSPRGLLDFKKRFLSRMKEVQLFYPEANVGQHENGLFVGASRLRTKHTGTARLSKL
jgi:hypothetical protein